MIFSFIIGPILINNSLIELIMNTFVSYASMHIIMSILSLDKSAVGLRLPILPILITAFKAVTPSGQLQTFVLAMPEERIILV
jgi:hypothetical protein